MIPVKEIDALHSRMSEALVLVLNNTPPGGEWRQKVYKLLHIAPEARTTEGYYYLKDGDVLAEGDEVMGQWGLWEKITDAKYISGFFHHSTRQGAQIRRPLKPNREQREGYYYLQDGDSIRKSDEVFFEGEGWRPFSEYIPSSAGSDFVYLSGVVAPMRRKGRYA